MSPAPYLIAASVVVAAAAWTLHLATGPDPLAVDSGLTVALGFMIFAVTDAAGLLLSRGRWARRLAIVLAAVGAALFLVTEPSVYGVVALAASAVSAIGALGPWLRGWIRKRPAAEGPRPRALVVAFGTLALVPLVGVASPAGITTWHGVLGAAGAILAWSYTRARLWSLWATRIALPLLTIPALFAGPWQGGVLLGVVVLTVVVAAWSEEAVLAVLPLYDRLPGPRVGRPRTDGPEHA